MKNSIESKIDKLFEAFEVPYEPVASGMQAAVTRKLTGVFSDASLLKYKEASDEQANETIKRSQLKIQQQAKTVLRNTTRVKSTDLTDMQQSGIDKTTAAVVTAVAEASGIKDVNVLQTAVKEFMTAMANIPEAEKLRIEAQRIGKKYGMNTRQSNALFQIVEKGEALDIYAVSKRMSAMAKAQVKATPESPVAAAAKK